MVLQNIFKQKTNFATRVVENELILVPVKNSVADMNELYTLNEVGCFIWDRINGQNSQKDIINAIVSEFNVDSETATIDFQEFLNNFQDFINKK